MIGSWCLYFTTSAFQKGIARNPEQRWETVGRGLIQRSFAKHANSQLGLPLEMIPYPSCYNAKCYAASVRFVRQPSYLILLTLSVSISLARLGLIKRISKFLCELHLAMTVPKPWTKLTKTKTLVLNLRHCPLILIPRLLIVPRRPRLMHHFRTPSKLTLLPASLLSGSVLHSNLMTSRGLHRIVWVLRLGRCEARGVDSGRVKAALREGAWWVVFSGKHCV